MATQFTERRYKIVPANQDPFHKAVVTGNNQGETVRDGDSLSDDIDARRAYMAGSPATTNEGGGWSPAGDPTREKAEDGSEEMLQYYEK